MTMILDLNKRAWTKVHGDITAIGTWIGVEGQFRPCLVLIPAGGEYSDRLEPCIVTVDKAWVWSEEIGDPAIAARTAFSFAETLGFTTDKRTVIRIASMINDHLGDLLTIPPYTRDRGEVLAEAVVTDSNGRQKEMEIRGDV